MTECLSVMRSMVLYICETDRPIVIKFGTAMFDDVLYKMACPKCEARVALSRYCTPPTFSIIQTFLLGLMPM